MKKNNILYAFIFFAFLIGLAGVILLCAYEVDWHITVIFAGGMIFFIGLVSALVVKINLRTAPILILCVVGALTAGIPAWLLLAERYPDKFPQLTDEQSMNIIAGGVMALSGICVMLFPLLSALHKKRYCTEPVMAKCVDIIVSKVKLDKRTVYERCPVWEFDFGGETYKVTESSFSDHGNVELGDIKEILINPLDPKEVYRKLKRSITAVIIFGSFFVIMGIWLCCL